MIAGNLDWHQVRPVVPYGPRHSYFVLPAFDASGLGGSGGFSGVTWRGVSEITSQFNYSATRNFSILDVPQKPSFPFPSRRFVPCVKFRVGEAVTRYKLWDDDRAVGMPWSEYNGEIIRANFCIEIWTVDPSTGSDPTKTGPALDADMLFPISIRTLSGYPYNVNAQPQADGTRVVYSELLSTDLNLPLSFNTGGAWLDNDE